MKYHYTQLGAVPAVASRAAERRDLLLAHTGPAARAMLWRINRLPRAQRVPELNRVLAQFGAGLPTRMHRTVEFLHREGMSVGAAVERGLALSLADATIERAKKLGQQARDGQLFPLSGGLGAETTEGESAGNVAAKMFQGIACSTDVAAATTDLVGRNEGADAAGATEIGFAVARGAALCPPGSAPPPPGPWPAEQEERGSALPLILGLGAAVAIGGVAWFMMARKK